MTSQQLTPMQTFQKSLNLKKTQEGFSKMLPSDVPVDKFTAVVVRAVQEDPAILNADRPSLFLACQRAAQDGLIPDKREGALVVYSVNTGTYNDPIWTKKVQWQIMIGGMRKRLAVNGFDLRTELVYENDTFSQDLGDNPEILHKPAQLGENRGKVIGAYAIATHIATGEKYREVMSIDDLNHIRSLAKSDKIWKTHEKEMQRKTVGRRLVKFLPITDVDDRMNTMMDNDNEHFDLAKKPGASDMAKRVQEVVREDNVIEHDDGPGPAETEPAPAKTVKQVPPEKVVTETENPAPSETENPAPAEETEPVPVSSQQEGMEPGF